MGNLALILKYAKYIPLLLDLITFIREAEKAFRGADTGPKKLAVVSEALSDMVTSLETAGVIPAKLAKVIRDGATVIVSLIVQLMNAEQGGVDDGEDDSAGAPSPQAGPRYLVKFDGPVPTNDELKARGYKIGDKVAGRDENSPWMIVRKNAPTLGMAILRTIE